MTGRGGGPRKAISVSIGQFHPSHGDNTAIKNRVAYLALTNPLIEARRNRVRANIQLEASRADAERCRPKALDRLCRLDRQGDD
jgi:hypothetical protein